VRASSARYPLIAYRSLGYALVSTLMLSRAVPAQHVRRAMDSSSRSSARVDLETKRSQLERHLRAAYSRRAASLIEHRVIAVAEIRESSQPRRRQYVIIGAVLGAVAGGAGAAAYAAARCNDCIPIQLPLVGAVGAVGGGVVGALIGSAVWGARYSNRR
jgi:hypothetical protein